MSDTPPELRTLDTSRARKDVVLTRSASSSDLAPGKGVGKGRRGRVLGTGIALTFAIGVTLGLGVSWVLGAASATVGLLATLVATARATAAPAALQKRGTRVQQLARRLEDADLPEAAAQELRSALRDLATARERDLAAQESIARTLATLDGPALKKALAAAQAEGDPETTSLRQRAVDTWQELLDRQEALKRGFARTEAALDALDVALAQATAPATPDNTTVEADSQRLLSQVEALRSVTEELDALESAPHPHTRSPERA